MMTDKAREARNAYMREYRRKNKDKIKAQREKYWERKAAENTPREEHKSYEAAAI